MENFQERVRALIEAAIVDHCQGADLWMASHLAAQKVMAEVRATALGVKPDRVACPEHRDLGPIPTCKACREQAQPHPACRFNGYSTRRCKLGTLGCVIDHKDDAGVPVAGKTVDGGM